MRSLSLNILCLSGIFLLSVSGRQVSAQISSPASDYSDILKYISDTVNFPDAPKTDPYFVFNAPVEGSPVTGSLLARAPGGTPISDFEWSRYDSTIKSFAPPFFTQSGVTSSTVNNLEAGGYKVHITSSGLDTLFRAWVFQNDPAVRVVKDADGKIPIYQAVCPYLRLVGSAAADTMGYSDLSTGRPLYLANKMSFEWTSDDPEYKIFGAKLYLDFYIYNSPPWSRPPTKDTRFTLTAVDSFNLTRSDNALYESVHVEAGFTMFYEERTDGEPDGNWTESEKPEEEAPLEIRFKNTSENGAEYKWILVDSAKTGEESEFTTFDVNDSLVYTYYTPGYYYPRMIAYSPYGCIDSFPLLIKPEIHVVPSELDVMNVFTPNGDGVNDFFMVRAKSLKSFKLTIYSRNGGKVYEYEHSDGRLEWEGWDGTLHGNGNNFVEPGVYYYVIDALGWDATIYRDIKPYTGFVYLYREAQ